MLVEVEAHSTPSLKEYLVGVAWALTSLSFPTFRFPASITSHSCSNCPAVAPCSPPRPCIATSSDLSTAMSRLASALSQAFHS